MKIRDNFGRIPCPAWLFLIFITVYHELMLHLWVTETIAWGRLAAVLGFALGFGGVLGTLVSLLPGARGRKWTAVAVALAITVFWIAEYFVSDAYRVFMPPKLMLAGAGGVATDYFSLVMSLIFRNLWRIGLLLLPTVVFALFGRCSRVKWRTRGVLAAAALCAYLLGMGAVKNLTPDAARLTTAYDFDSAVRCFGLHMGVALETMRDGAMAGDPAFTAAPEAPTEETVPETQPEETLPPVVYGDQVMEGLDFEQLAETEVNSHYASIHRYVASLTPAKKNQYTGLLEGKNLILVTAEAFSAEAIDPERTPTLYRMANEGIRFEEYYQPAWGASTTSGEFSNLVGLVPVTGGMCMMEAKQQNLFLTMGNQLQELGYTSFAYHNHIHNFYQRDETHVHLGYDEYKGLYGGLEGVDAVWTESDKQMVEATLEDYIDQQPFSIYYMTVSGHTMYTQNENYQAKKNYHVVADMDASEALKCYLAAQLELEYAMETLVAALEEKGIADDTVIVLATDHFPYGLEESSTWQNSRNHLAELFGVEDYDNFTRDHNALIIWSGCLEDMDLVVEEPVYSLDILPTLSNLFGLEYDSRLLVGRDVFSQEPALVLWPDFNWITDKGTYDRKTDTFTPREGVTIPEGYVEYISTLVSNKITYSRSVQNWDYFNVLAKLLGRQR